MRARAAAPRDRASVDLQPGAELIHHPHDTGWPLASPARLGPELCHAARPTPPGACLRRDAPRAAKHTVDRPKVNRFSRTAACRVVLRAAVVACLSAALTAWAAPPGAAAPSATAATAESAGDPALDSATVAEIIKEVEIGAALAEADTASQPASRKGAAAPHRPVSSPDRAASAPQAIDSPYSLRGRSKAAWEWVKDTLPWLQRKDGGEEAREPVVYDPLGVPGSPFDGTLGARGAGGVGFGAGLGGAGAGGHGTVSVAPGGSPDPSADNVMALVRDAVRVIEEAIAHPMTWLVVALFAIGGFAMKKFDRRPK